ncbi:SDR family NAD(P)-dependent oxidoreductase [Sandarakinorhabdus oryzae]|uniref:SDR family NAD(P)-dependent oxidoreductase n=1 Tax=Sandarakinorhabdus oryzae TaxID=2675220 RepID=UPI0012E32CF4|nr:SDR family NAD(P)-dependent oxidoreductase [Sandarakinorhabdus oryzae]
MNIVMTGGSRGIGAEALRHLTAQPGARILIGVRGPAPAGTTGLPLDLASLASVGSFADAVIAALGGSGIDALVLNAGGQRPTVAERSVDGHELTFAANHLGHFLLLQRLWPHLASGARVVITSSGTHDPEERTGVPPPRHANAYWLADPTLDPKLDASPITAGMRAYSASKLANLMTARVAALRAAADPRGISVVAYDPGLTPGTGLVRQQMWLVRALVWPLLPLMVPFSRMMNPLSASGRGLADLATTLRPPPGQVYAALRKSRMGWPEPSALARDDAACAALWADSLALCGLPPD